MLNSIQREAKNAAAAYFRRFTPASTEPDARDIIGWGIGAKVIDGVLRPEENVLRVYIREFPEPTIEAEFGLPIEFIEVGQITAYQNRDQHRPVLCGVSVGHPNIAAGTLGCLVEKEGNHYILSNNHVLADSNHATPGDPVIQPGSIDGGTSPEDDIATLEPYSEIDFSGDANDIDAAIALVGGANQTLVSPEIIDIGTPSSTPCPASLGQTVRKSGRTTEHTVGVVEDISGDFWVDYGNESAWFEDQIVVRSIDTNPFVAPGDSGSLIVDKQMLEPVALLFAGSDSGLAIANHINLVLDYYGVTVVGEQGVNT
jgi:hypothetical protein